jgi:hypothetical protein
VPRSLLPVFERFFDDAGLFPPASRPMAEALAAHARARVGPHRLLVGTFLCPLGRLEELDACVAAGLPRPPDLGVLAYPGETRWHRAASRADIVQVEAPLDARLPADLVRVRRYMELPARGDLALAFEELRRAGARARLRCGGPAPDLVPSSQRLAELLVACATRRVMAKTAGGPHHPFRLPASVAAGPQHGFVNLLAAASASMGGAEVAEVVEILDTEAERGEELLSRIDRHARLVVSVPCSSFDETVSQLRALGVL